MMIVGTDRPDSAGNLTAGSRVVDARLCAAVFAFFLALFWLTNTGFDTSEADNHYRVAEHILARGQLGFAEEQTGIFTKAPNSRWYASHELGNTVLLLPAAALNRTAVTWVLRGRDAEFIRYAKGFIISLHPGVYIAATLTAVFALLMSVFGLRLAMAALSTLLLGVTTYLWTYSRILFDGVLCTALLTISTLLLFQYRTNRRLFFLTGAFALAGFAVVTRVSMVLAVIASLAYVLALEWRRPSAAVRLVLIAVVTLLPFAIWQMWYNDLRTGMPLLSPVQMEQYASNNALDGPILVGLAGLLFSPGKSVFVYSPLAALGVVLFHRFRARFPAESIYVGVLLVLWFVVHAKLRDPHGAWGWGPRHFVTIVPIMFLPFAVELPTVLANRWYRRSAYVLAGWGFVLALSSIVSNWHFRMGLAVVEGRIAGRQFVWSLMNSQAVDMVSALPGNLLRWLGEKPLLEVPGASPLNTYASSTVNVWPNTVIRVGIPLPLVLLAVTVLIGVCVTSALFVVRHARREQEFEREVGRR